jgi:hypothetical protein
MDKIVQANPASEHRLGRSFTKERMVGCSSRISVLPVVIVIHKVILDNPDGYQVDRVFAGMALESADNNSAA